MGNAIYTLQGNSQKLDAGAMFGNVPKELWQKWVMADEHNRISLKCRCLLVELGDRRILFETGIGAYFSPALKERYGVVETSHRLLESLQMLSLSHEDITDVILSHLHFDHAGGLLSAYEEGKGPQLLFPRAHFYISEEAFKRAKNPHRRDKASFIPDLPRMLEESQRLHLLAPSQSGNGRSQEGESFGRVFKDSSLPDCLSFRQSDGHTPGLLHSYILGEEIKLFFASDLIPGIPWVHLPVTMGYDRFPEKLVDEKEEVLRECKEKGISLFFTHDSDISLCQVTQDAQGKYIPLHPQPDFPQGRVFS